MGAGEPADVDHFIAYLGLHVWHEDGRALGRATITPHMWAPGTRRVRLGLLFTMADVVGGSPPGGPLSPTVDLRFQLLAPAPSQGEVVLAARPLKAGRRLWTGEVLLYGPELFARCDFSFMNQPIGLEADRPSRQADSPVGPPPAASFDDLFQMRYLDDGVVEMDSHQLVRNGVVGTIQGGAQATMAELAAERALSERGEHAVWDLHLRYLNALRTGPALARPEVLPGEGLNPVVRIAITDEGDGGRLVSSAVAVCRHAPG